MGFLSRRDAEGRAVGEEDESGRDPDIGSAGADVGATGVELSYTG